jgi:thiol:disulfide interchange protein
MKNILLGLIAFLSISIVGAFFYKSNHRTTRVENWQWNNNWNQPNNTPNNPNTPDPIIDSPTPNEQPIKNYQDALKASEKNKKPIVVFFSAEWCPYCKKMEKEVLSDDTVQKSLQKVNFVKVDVDKERDIATKFGIQKIPSHLVTNSKEAKLKFEEKYMNTNEYLAWLAIIEEPQIKPQPKKKKFFGTK